MNKKILLLISSVLLSLSTFSQSTFQRVYPFTNPYTALNFVPTLDNNYLIYETATSYIYLMKINSIGDTLWTKTIYLQNFDLHDLAILHDSGFALIGTLNIYDYSCVIKIDKNGDTLWTRATQFPSSFLNSGIAIHETTDSAIFAVSTHDSVSANQFIQFQKYNNNGNLMWTKNYYLGSDFIGVGDVILTSEKDFLIYVSQSMGGPSIPYSTIMTSDSLGNMTNLGHGDFPGYNGGNFMVQSSDKSFFFIANHKDNWGDDGYGTLVKFDSTLVFDWQQSFVNSSRMKSVSSASNNGCITTCDSLTYPNKKEFQLKCFDSNGTLLWSNLFPINHNETAAAVHQTPDGGFLAIGNHFLPSGQIETYIVKTDSTGQLNSNGYNITLSDSLPCQGDTVILSVQNALSYLWSTGDTTQTISTIQNGSYNVRVQDSLGTIYYTTFSNVFFNPLPSLSLGNDTLLCTTQTFLLDAGNNFANYLWQDSTTAQTFLAEDTASATNDTLFYFVTVTDTNGCTATDTLQIIFDICQAITTHEKAKAFLNLAFNNYKQTLFISANNLTEKNLSLSIFDITGRKLFQSDYQITPPYFTTDLPCNYTKGIYFLTLTTPTKRQTARFIIQ